MANARLAGTGLAKVDSLPDQNLRPAGFMKADGTSGETAIEGKVATEPAGPNLFAGRNVTGMQHTRRLYGRSTYVRKS